MDDRERERLAITRAVLRALRHREFRHEFSLTNRNGEHIIVPVLPDDTMGSVFAQFRDVQGPAAYLASVQGDEVIILAVRQEATMPAPNAEQDCLIHPNTHFAMLLAYLKKHRGPLVLHEVQPGVTVELVEEGEAVHLGR